MTWERAAWTGDREVDGTESAWCVCVYGGVRGTGRYRLVVVGDDDAPEKARGDALPCHDHDHDHDHGSPAGSAGLLEKPASNFPAFQSTELRTLTF